MAGRKFTQVRSRNRSIDSTVWGQPGMLQNPRPAVRLAVGQRKFFQIHATTRTSDSKSVHDVDCHFRPLTVSEPSIVIVSYSKTSINQNCPIPSLIIIIIACLFKG
ncbi:hypothetical protein RRG08_046934 [Elysia crispata]|uniref:Uncharacterized protein n=1 Tax=Elysia crispata TaxID=231223 RepID=A0AAE1A8B3_9GAST|nr:hypothetical protein RRG08_046934 [Elysia crispata]